MERANDALESFAADEVRLKDGANSDHMNEDIDVWFRLQRGEQSPMRIECAHSRRNRGVGPLQAGGELTLQGLLAGAFQDGGVLTKSVG